MDYGKTLRRAWEITWRWKVLWILGFLTALGQSGNNSNNFNFSTPQGENIGIDFPPQFAGFLVMVICVLFIIGIALWVISIIARGGLIAGVNQVETEGDTSLKRAWSAGVGRFWTLLGIGVLTSLPILIVGLLLLGGGIAVAVGAGITAGMTESWAALGMLAPLLVCAIPIICLMVIAGIVLNQIRIYAERAAVLEEMNWVDSVKQGWQVIRDNLGPTVVYWLIFLFINLVIGFAVFGMVLVLVAPFLALGFGLSTARDLAPLMVLPMICGGLFAALLGAAIGSVIETFRSSTWTLVYRELVGLGASSVNAPDPIAEEAEETNPTDDSIDL